MRRCGANTSFSSANVSAMDWLARRLTSSPCIMPGVAGIDRAKAVVSLGEGVLSILFS